MLQCVKRCPLNKSDIQCSFLTNLLHVTGHLTRIHTQKSKMFAKTNYACHVTWESYMEFGHIFDNLSWICFLICLGEVTSQGYLNQMLNSPICFSVEIFMRNNVCSQFNKVNRFTHNLTSYRISYKFFHLDFIKANFHLVTYTFITLKPDLDVANVITL